MWHKTRNKAKKEEIIEMKWNKVKHGRIEWKAVLSKWPLQARGQHTFLVASVYCYEKETKTFQHSGILHNLSIQMQISAPNGFTFQFTIS